MSTRPDWDTYFLHLAQVGIALAGSRIYIYSSRGDLAPCRECEKVRKAAGVLEVADAP